MSSPAAIAASLVDVRNVAAHKCLRLEIHVPVEQAPAVMAAFGWPTAVEPVPVAIARLAEPGKRGSEARSEPGKAGTNGGQRRWEALPRAQRAGIRCEDAAFKRFLNEVHSCEAHTPDEAADAVRELCRVASRSEFNTDSEARERWDNLDRDFLLWMQGRMP